MAKSHLKLVTPTEVKRTVAPKRQKNAELRTREHFTSDEVEALIEAAKGNRYGHRDATMVLPATAAHRRRDRPRHARAPSLDASAVAMGSRRPLGRARR
jgi:hypothetical protein